MNNPSQEATGDAARFAIDGPGARFENSWLAGCPPAPQLEAVRGPIGSIYSNTAEYLAACCRDECGLMRTVAAEKDIR